MSDTDTDGGGRTPGDGDPPEDGNPTAADPSATGAESTADAAKAEYPDVPDWEDEYVDRVSDRIMFNYDLEKAYRVDGESFTLFGALEMESYKQFFHPSIRYGHHESFEYLFVRKSERASVAEIERLVELGHDLAERWIDRSERHYSTEFTFAVVVPDLTDEVREFVSGFSGRSLLKYGMHGHYEIHLVAVDPEGEELVHSPNADVADAFRVWAPIESRPGLVERLKRRLLG